MFLVEMCLSRLSVCLRYIETCKILLQIRDIWELIAQKVFNCTKRYQTVCSAIHSTLGHNTKFTTIGIFPLTSRSSISDLLVGLMQSLRMDTNETSERKLLYFSSGKQPNQKEKRKKEIAGCEHVVLYKRKMHAQSRKVCKGLYLFFYLH